MTKLHYQYCPQDCKYLNVSEEAQQKLKREKVQHKCLKYDVRLYHMLAHPKLYKCGECINDEVLNG